MTVRELLNDLKSSFSFKNFVANKIGSYEDNTELGYIRNIKNRGRDQIFCFIAHLKAWKREEQLEVIVTNVNIYLGCLGIRLRALLQNVSWDIGDKNPLKG